MKDKTMITWITLLIIMLVFIDLLFLLATLYNYPDPDYRLSIDGGNCSIGRPEIAGDFIVNPDNKNPLNFGDARACAIKDCEIFNKYQDLREDQENRVLCLV